MSGIWETSPAKVARRVGPVTASPARLRGSVESEMMSEADDARQRAEAEIARWLPAPTPAPANLSAMYRAVPRYVKACMDKEIEVKFINMWDGIPGSTTPFNPPTWKDWVLNGFPIQGTGDNAEMVGNKIHVKTLELRLQVYSPGASDVARFLVLRDRKNTFNTAPVNSEVFTATGLTSAVIAPFNPLFVDTAKGISRYEVLVDERFILQPTVAAAIAWQHRTYHLKLEFPVTYNQINAPIDNALWYGFCGQEGTAGLGCRFTEQFMYTDA